VAAFTGNFPVLSSQRIVGLAVVEGFDRLPTLEAMAIGAVSIGELPTVLVTVAAGAT